MTQTKKIVLGTQHALDKAIEFFTAKGWEVEKAYSVPRGRLSSKSTYILSLKRDK